MKKAIIVAVWAALLPQTRHAHAISEWEIVKQAAEAGYTIYDRFLSDELTLEEALDEILAKIASSRDAIMDHMDNLAAIEARTCAKASVSDFENIQVYGPNAVLVAGDMYECIVRLHTTIAAVQDQAVADELGFALHALAPMALHAYAYTGLSPTQLVAEVLEAEATIDQAVEPACYHHRSCEGTQHCECSWTCTAYNGDVGHDSRMCRLGDGYRNVAVREALERTSALISSGL
jgi:hypothetical protein